VSRFLLDINVLIALIDPAHVQHDRAHEWFAALGKQAWATCPLTENGVLRIVGHARYLNSPGTPAAVIELMKSLRALPGHEFWRTISRYVMVDAFTVRGCWIRRR
jgi:predicted nucleic acid-binding protein